MGDDGGDNMNTQPDTSITALIAGAKPVEVEPIDLKEAGLSQRDALLEVCDRAQIWRSPEGETFATVEVAGHVEHHAVESRGFRDWMIGELARRYVNKGRPASANESAIRDARIGLEARAHRSGLRREAALRIASHSDGFCLDLGGSDWSAISVSANGWQRIAHSPVPILRTRRTASFPEPSRGDGFGLLRQLLAQLPDDDYILFIAWCLGAFLPAGPHPILILGGEHGSGKSTLARLAQRLTDPVLGDLLQPPGDDRDLIAAARNNRVLAFDNFSGIRSELADSLCRLATGSEIGGRALYSNHETASFSACRPLVLNGIPDLAARGDLADRAIVLRLDAPAERITERDWATRVTEVMPALLAAFLDALVAGVANLANVETPPVRMADFARFVVAAEPALPWSPGAFLSAYQHNRGQAIAALVEGDVVATTLTKFMQRHPEGWEGLVADLYDSITPEFHRPPDWPGNPRWYSDRLRRAAPALRAFGIDVQARHGRRGTSVHIRKIASLASPASRIAAPSQVPRPERDGSDASDAISPLSGSLSEVRL
jgi:hypothetical protein